MKFHTKKYDIAKVDEADGFDNGIKYEINLHDGYKFQSDDSHLNYAESYDSLRELIADIIEE